MSAWCFWARKASCLRLCTTKETVPAANIAASTKRIISVGSAKLFLFAMTVDRDFIIVYLLIQAKQIVAFFGFLIYHYQLMYIDPRADVNGWVLAAGWAVMLAIAVLFVARLYGL
jgi:hypothetical protein